MTPSSKTSRRNSRKTWWRIQTQKCPELLDLKDLDEKADLQKKSNDILQKNLNELRKKLDAEYGKLQDICNIKNNDDEKWKVMETRMEEIKNTTEELYKKIKYHDSEIINLTSNVLASMLK